MEINDMIGELILDGDIEVVVGLARILQAKQTEDEQRFDMTVHKNDVGFNSADAPFVGRYLDAHKPTTPDSLELRLRLYKYRGQLRGFTKEEWVKTQHKELLQASTG